MANAEQAAAVNKGWETLLVTYDAYYDTLPKVVQNTIKKAVSDWQDFYFGSDTWPIESLNGWTTVLNKARQTLYASIPIGAIPTDPKSATTQAKKTNVKPVFIIQGAKPTSGLVPDFPLPKWWWFALGGLPALAILYFTRKVL